MGACGGSDKDASSSTTTDAPDTSGASAVTVPTSAPSTTRGPSFGPAVAIGPSGAGAVGLSGASGQPGSSGTSGSASPPVTSTTVTSTTEPVATVKTAGVLRVSKTSRDTDEPRAGALPEGTEDLEQGECYDPAPDPTQRAIIALTLPCDGAHVYEVYAVLQTPEGPFAEYPGDGKLREFAEASCFGLFSAFVGVEWKQSNLDFETFFPTVGSWARERDRKVTCSLYDRKFKDLIGTANGSAY